MAEFGRGGRAVAEGGRGEFAYLIGLIFDGCCGGEEAASDCIIC